MTVQQQNASPLRKEGPRLEMERYDRHELEQFVQA